GRLHPLETRGLAVSGQGSLVRKFRIEGKVAVITGAGSGIGQAIALAFAAHGATIRILDVNDGGASETSQKISAMGGRASIHVCDVTDQGQVMSTSSELSKPGRMDTLVTNAGVSNIVTVEST